MGYLGLQQYSSQLIWNHKSKKKESAVKNWAEPELVQKRTAISFGTCGLRYEKSNSCSLLLSSFIDLQLILSCRQFQVSEALFGVMCTRASLHMIHNNDVFGTYTAALCHPETATPNRASWPDAKANSYMEWVMDWPSPTTPAHHSCMCGSCVVCPTDISIIPPSPWVFSCSQQNTQAESRA